MASLDVQVHQPRLMETGQMNARGGWTDLADERQLRARSRSVVQQREQHAGTRGLADRSGDGRRCLLDPLCRFHTSMIDEASRTGKWYRTP